MDSATDGERPARRISPALIATVTLVLVIGLLTLYLATRNGEQDKLRNPQLTQVNGVEPEKRCSSQATFDLLKRSLFQRAAQIRGSDQAEYDQIAASAALRVEDPAFDSQDKDGAINCSGSVSIDLPPDVAVNGGSRTLMSDVDYTIQAGENDGGDVILLRNADAIVAPLSTLSRTEQPSAATGAITDNAAADNESDTAVPAAPQPASPAPVAAPAPPQPQAGFDCSTARSRGEVAVCSDPGLAELDRAMTAQYRRALSQAEAGDQALLRSTGQRFIAYRDHCPNTACMTDAYTGRMREIRDISEGRWQAPR